MIQPGTIRKDLTGKKFGKLTVLKPDENFISGKPRKWVCLCECGTEVSVRGTNLGKSTISCGCYNKKNNQSKETNLKDSTGEGEFASKIKPLNIKKLSFKEFCSQYGLSAKVVRNRLKKGWTVQRALKTPVDEDISRRNKNSRIRGKKLELHVISFLRNLFEGILDEDDIRKEKVHGVDVQLSKKGRKEFPFSIECKNTVELSYTKAFQQARDNKYPNTLPAIIWRDPIVPYKEAIIIFNFEEFSEFWKQKNSEEINVEVANE